MPVEVRPVPVAMPEASIEVVLGQAVVRVGAGADATTLRTVLVAAREAGC